MAMFQVMGMNNGIYPKNQIEQMELSKMLLLIEKDFYDAQRVYYWTSKLQETGSANGGNLYSGTHAVTVTQGEYTNLWNIGILPSDASTFYTNWNANNANITKTVSDSNNNYYTLLFLGAGSNINAVLYLTCTQSGTGVTYTMTRYESNGSRLVLSQSFSYYAPGATFASSDQGSALPSVGSEAGVYCGISVRLPTAFSSALKDLGTGKTARRVKYTADAWGTWAFTPDGAGRWIKQ
jgi:hypothetical protein